VYTYAGKERYIQVFGGEDNIKMDIQEMGWGMDWIEVAQDRDRWRALVNAAMGLLLAQNAGNFLTS
jgi:hypothetical protein